MWRSSKRAGSNTMSDICGEIRHPSGVHGDEREVHACRGSNLRGSYPRLMANAPSGQAEGSTPR